MEVVYRGTRTREGCVVRKFVDGEDGGPLDPRLGLRNHSPAGFEWGYGGSGPAQLALALLSDAAGETRATPCYQAFKWQVVGRLPHDGWELEATQILEWLHNHEAAGAGEGPTGP